MQRQGPTTTFVEIKKAPMTLKEAGEKIKIARNARGWTQQDLAEAAGVKQWTVSKIENGYTEAGRGNRVKLLLVLDLQLPIITPTNEEIQAYKNNLGKGDESHEQI